MFILLFLLFVIICALAFSKSGGSINYLKVDHIMFPFCNNKTIISETADKFDKKYYTIGAQQELYKGIYVYYKDYYIEYLTTIPTEEWSNAIAVVVDKKYWSFYKKPDILTEHFLTPKFGCGFFLVSPDFPYIYKGNRKNKLSTININISKKLYNKLQNICGLKWTLPNFLKIDKSLKKVTDINPNF